MNYLFGINGRIGRMHWWLGSIAVFIIYLLALSFIGGGLLANLLAISFAISTFNFSLLSPQLLVTITFTSWIIFTLTGKRYHDRNKSGFWYLLIFIPIIGPLWQLVELGFLRGTAGANNYGPPAGNIFDADSFEAEIASEYAPSASIQASIDAAVATRKNPELASPRRQPSFGGQPTFGKRGL